MSKVALVTGGSRGIGAAIARRLAWAGADVAITYKEAVERAHAVLADVESAGRRGRAVKVDAADPSAVVDAVEQVAHEFGRLDVLVNNAGMFMQGPLEEATNGEVQRMLSVHVTAPFVASQAAARHMTHGGRIINIGSSFAERVPYPGVTAYAMTKSALVGLTKGLARDLGPRGITANLIHAGSTDTEMNPANSEWADDERSLTALGRYCDPEDIAATVGHLAGESGRTITGAVVSVDAGANA